MRKRCGTNISITLWDERYTSKEAATRIKAEAIARKSRIPSASDLETELDADAACIILEDYYKEFGEESEVIVLEGMKGGKGMCGNLCQEFGIARGTKEGYDGTEGEGTEYKARNDC